MKTASELIQFWYSQPMNKHWFHSTPEIDQQIREQYEALWQDAAKGRLDHWKQSAEGCLALIILLDQLPLNMFRGEARSFATEASAIETTLRGIEQGFDRQLDQSHLSFFYMPLMHSENLTHQDLSVKLFEQASLKKNARFAHHHRELIQRFGRFPHRNVILGRESSADELNYLRSEKAFKG